MPFSGPTFIDTELLATVKKELYERSRLLSPDATLAVIQDLKVWIGEELSFEEAASTSFGRLLSDLWLAEYLDQLPPLLNRFDRLAAAYFVRRGSVTAFHGFCNAWREGVLRRVLQFAEEELEIDDHGHAPTPYALLAAGSLGRHEQTIEQTDPYFLMWPRGEAKYFERFTYRVIAILDQLGLIGKDGTGSAPRGVWRGAMKEWELYVDAQGEGQDAGVRKMIADLRHICGDDAVGRQAVDIARGSLARCREEGRLRDLAGQTVAMPVAVGPFGRIRVEKNEQRRGWVDLAQFGLCPLVCGVRLLAMQHDLEPGPTLARLEALAALGVLEKRLATRLQGAYHRLAGFKIVKEIALEAPCVELASLSRHERQKLRESLEAVRDLQRHLKRTQFAPR